MTKIMVPQETDNVENFNSVYMMADSGARGSAAQLKQLSGMRGLMANHLEKLLKLQLFQTLKKVLSVLEYFNSSHGARKGLADTALKTANSGYLTRRLVDVAQDCIITIDDCFTSKFITIEELVEDGEVLEILSERVLGRTLAEDIVDKESNSIIASAGELVSEEHLKLIDNANMTTIKVRSVLTCEAEFGVCSKCYGRDLARGTSVNIGEAVGVIAAQSIGEPGTQLTMRTFHIGGAAQKGTEISNIESKYDGVIKYSNLNITKDSAQNLINMSRNSSLSVIDNNNKERARHRLPFGCKLKFQDKQKIKSLDVLAEWDPFTFLLSQISGYIVFKDLEEGITTREIVDDSTGLSSNIVIDWKQQAKHQNLVPRVEIHDKSKNGKVLVLENGSLASYELTADSIILITDGMKVKDGDSIAKIPKESSKTKDITGGLPRVAELFEARKPKDHAIIAEISGKIKFGKDYKMKRKIEIVPEDSKA